MGFLDRFRRPDLNGTMELAYDGLAELDEAGQSQVLGALVFLGVVTILRILNHQRNLGGTRLLDLSALNDACMYKEVFLAYLNAALLEPVLAIAGMEEAVGEELVINIFTLGSICWWIWMVTDAFDSQDICQRHKYSVDIQDELQGDAASKYTWLRVRPTVLEAAQERRTLLGSIQRDVALWFVLASIGAAWLPGPVTHRGVMHSYVIVILWALLHRSCRRATAWSSGYLVSLLFPSTVLMPMEYCLPFMDTADCVEDLEFVVSYREFVKESTGVELEILS